jgi:DNA-binding transcriptional regulator GbsR (MarR family)
MVSNRPSVNNLLETLLAEHDSDLVDVTIDKLAKKAGISRRSTSRALAELERIEVIRTSWQRNGRRGGRYSVAVDRDRGIGLATELAALRRIEIQNRRK